MNVATDYQSINYWSFKFPRTLSFENNQKLDFEVLNTSDLKSRIDIVNSNLVEPLGFVVGSEPYKLSIVSNNVIQQFLVPKSSTNDRQKVVV